MALIQVLDGFDMDALLAPIAEDVPAGTDIRQDYSPTSLYFRLRDARAEARDAERQSEASGTDEVVPQQWRSVQSIAMTALGAAKDLEVAAWLTEALVRTGGLRGLATGAVLIAGLMEVYWDDLFPTPDEDGIETRVGPLAGLSGQGYDGTLLQPLRKMSLFSRPDGSPFGLWRYEATLELSGISDATRRGQRIEAGVVPFDEVEKEARAAGSAHWSTQRNEVLGAMSAWTAMTSMLEAKAGDVSPSTTRVRDVLQLLLDTCNRFAPAIVDEATADEQQAAPSGTTDAAASTGGAPPNAAAAAIAGREQALRQLGEVAQWFRRTEPHSPLSYTLEEAIRRGRMTWPELMGELIPDETTRMALMTSLGMKPTPPEE